MNRGEIWWARFDAPIGHRPAVLVSRTDSYEHRQIILVVPVSTHIRRLPAELPLGPPDGLPRACVANADSLTTLPKFRLQQLVGPLSAAKMADLDDALRYALGLD